jgi:hypothetical protein
VSPILDIPRATAIGYCWDVTGEVRFYDEIAAWGVIRGADGALYVVNGNRIMGPPLRVGERVLFEPQPAQGGPRAAGVRRLRVGAASSPRSG